MKKIKSNEYSKKWMTLFIVITMSFMSCLDSSIVNVALPVLTKELKTSLSSIEWVVVSYLIIICSTILIFGRLGDMIGKAHIFKFGIILFTIGSFLCGLCHSLQLLVICRVIQGIGASAYMANNQGIITQTFPNNERGKALGILAAAVALGTMIGPPLGGFILSVLSWNSIFFVNVPIGIIALIFSIKVLPKAECSNEKMDKKGALLFSTGTVFLFGSLILGQKTGYDNLFIMLAILIGILMIVFFIKRELKETQPLLELQLFKNKIFSLSLVCAFISSISISASIILIPFYLQNTIKISTAKSGLFMMIFPIIVAIISPAAGRISDKIGSELITLGGLLLMSIGFLLMSLLNEFSPLIMFVTFISIMAVGQGLFQPANNSLIMSSVPKNKLGIAGSINSLVRNFAQIAGVTLSTSFLYGFMSHKLKYHVSDYVIGKDYAFIYGMKNVYIILSVISCIGTICTAIRFYRSKFSKT